MHPICKKKEGIILDGLSAQLNIIYVFFFYKTIFLFELPIEMNAAEPPLSVGQNELNTPNTLSFNKVIHYTNVVSFCILK